jgi:hypothetical protein
MPSTPELPTFQSGGLHPVGRGDLMRQATPFRKRPDRTISAIAVMRDRMA